MVGKRETNPGGSSNPLRADVLRVLGVLRVLKVATADQIQRPALPHLTYRHTDKPTEAAPRSLSLPGPPDPCPVDQAGSTSGV
ncbi:hypothetical protein [Streptomyces sp. NPDC019890]|uniref:hypothetical protein n=1 Tax=Streptomyces sp. NPDC019890 TaxID=3365064 RepID=UPI00384D6B77